MRTRSHSEQAGILLFGKTLATISEALVPLLIVRLLGKTEVGIFGKILLLYTTIALILTAGFPNALMCYLPGRTLGQRRAVTWKVGRILLVVGGLTALLLLALPALVQLLPTLTRGLIADHADGAGRNGATALRYLYLLALFPLADIPGRLLPMLLVVEGRARTAAAMGVAQALGNSLVVVLPLALGFNLWVVVGSICLFGYLYAGVTLAFMMSIYRGAERESSPVSTRDLVRFAVPLGVTDVVAILNSNFDKFLIAVTFSSAVFADFQAGAWQIPMLTAIPYSVATAYTPRFAELFQSGAAREAIRIWRGTIVKVALLVLPLAAVFIVGAEETIEILFTPAYLRAASVFRLYSIMMLGRVAGFGAVIVAAGQPSLIMQAAALSLVANVVLCVPLLYGIGFNGPALGTVLAFIPMVIFYCRGIAKATGLPFREIFPFGDYLKILSVTLVSCIPAVLFKMNTHLPAVPRLVIIALLVLAAFSALGTLTRRIAKEDWRYLEHWLKLKILR